MCELIRIVADDRSDESTALSIIFHSKRLGRSGAGSRRRMQSGAFEIRGPEIQLRGSDIGDIARTSQCSWRGRFGDIGDKCRAQRCVSKARAPKRGFSRDDCAWAFRRGVYKLQNEPIRLARLSLGECAARSSDISAFCSASADFKGEIKNLGSLRGASEGLLTISA
jgi:hypothetical protein